MARDWMAHLRNKLGAALLQAEVLTADETAAPERAAAVLRNVRLAVEALEGLDRALLDPASAISPLGPHRAS